MIRPIRWLLSDLAFLYHFQAVFGWGDSVAEVHTAAGDAARKAVQLDDSDATAHTVLAIYEYFRTGMRRPGAAYVVRLISIQIQHSLMAISVSVTPLPANANCAAASGRCDPPEPTRSAVGYLVPV